MTTVTNEMIERLGHMQAEIFNLQLANNRLVKNADDKFKAMFQRIENIELRLRKSGI